MRVLRLIYVDLPKLQGPLPPPGSLTQIYPCLPRSTVHLLWCRSVFTCHLAPFLISWETTSIVLEGMDRTATEWRGEERDRSGRSKWRTGRMGGSVSKESDVEMNIFFGRKDVFLVWRLGATDWMDENLLIWILKQSWELSLDQDKGSASCLKGQCFVLQFILVCLGDCPSSLYLSLVMHQRECLIWSVWGVLSEEVWAYPAQQIWQRKAGIQWSFRRANRESHSWHSRP